MGRVVRRWGAAFAVGCAALMGVAASASAALPPIKHVFIIVGENESLDNAFNSTVSTQQYLAKMLPSEGAYLSQYYTTGHASLDNYIAMVSGQAPNPDTSADCIASFADFPADSIDPATGQENGSGCVYSPDVPTLMSQMDAANLTWRGYMDSMGADAARDGGTTCAHPPLNAPDGAVSPTPTDQYATRHNPFVYFDYVIDKTAECAADDVPLVPNLDNDLASVSTTPNYVFITPGICDDGHDASCLSPSP